ncbi:MAG: MATE family efflux transporter, partial [Deltaproteobacteria bacterium]|nr:MATE family efflux transporter [Deltaproteobacteria bacterium]
MNNKLDVLSGKTLSVFFYYAVPSIFGMLAMSSAAVIDAAFLGNYAGITALAAVNLTFPFWALLGGIEIMLAT